jgi:predicted nucleotidyltransferase component of viral defense system
MLYILGKMNYASSQNTILKALSGKINDFYLAGGTALSLFYFRHRQSLDLDFFTQDFKRLRVRQIINALSVSLNKEIEIAAERGGRKNLSITVAYAHVTKNGYIKIDFVQDILSLIKPPVVVNGIRVLSLEDIYLRKISAICGVLQLTDDTGRNITKGKRQEAKDLYDLYFLSHTFMRLSAFFKRYCDALAREAIITWWRTYGRLSMRTGLLELKTNKNISYRAIEAHIEKEIGIILEEEIEAV